jgi:hypothetical protein
MRTQLSILSDDSNALKDLDPLTFSDLMLIARYFCVAFEFICYVLCLLSFSNMHVMTVIFIVDQPFENFSGQKVLFTLGLFHLINSFQLHCFGK